MKLIFCADPISPGHPDTAYEAEADAAQQLGIDYALINFEALVNEADVVRSVQRVSPSPTEQLCIYRGWMLRPAHYAQLYAALLSLGLHLINSPAAYRHAHYLPEWYALLEGHTPRSVWIPLGGRNELDQALPLLATFGEQPVIVKDYVKSQKHYWWEACFIPSAADSNASAKVVRRFLELQGDDLNEGLVFREFADLTPLTTHSLSGMPLTAEFRLFVLDGKPVLISPYWEEGDYTGIEPPVAQFVPLIRQVQSRFFTMDIAKLRQGDWIVMEIGDAQVAGLPSSVAANQFYTTLIASLA